MEGRWFTGGYDEIGLDVRLERVGAETRVLGTDRTALKQGATGQELKIYGANLPAACGPRDIDLGPGLTVTRVVSVDADLATVVVDVAAAAAIGTRDLFVAGASRPKALAVYDRIDAIKVKPDWAMARVGGGRSRRCSRSSKRGRFSNGADGKPDTPDDIELGLVDAAWSMEEYTATYDDDDIRFVGDVERGDRPLHAEHRRSESGAQRLAQQHRRRVGRREGTRRCRSAASRRRRFARGRICSSPCRCTCASIRLSRTQ